MYPSGARRINDDEDKKKTIFDAKISKSHFQLRCLFPYNLKELSPYK